MLFTLTARSLTQRLARLLLIQNVAGCFRSPPLTLVAGVSGTAARELVL